MPEQLQDIIRSVKIGDRKAFRVLVGLYQQPAYRVAFRILGNEEEARDAVQECFIKVWQKIGTYDPAKDFLPWMYRILANASIDRQRAISRHLTVPIEQVAGQVDAMQDAGPDDSDELAGLAAGLAEMLTGKQKAVFILRDLEGLKSEEVEMITGMNETAVKTNLYHARKKVRERLLAILLFTGCREITVRTTINSDGSLLRTVTVTGDSAEAFRKELPWPVDSGWTVTARKDTAGKGIFTVTYSRQYRNVEELQTETAHDTSWFRDLRRSLDIRKRFGFFYSYVEYRETYPAANPFRTVPWQNRLSPEDMRWLTRKHAVQSPSDSLLSRAAEEKMMQYLSESAAAELVNILAGGIRTLNDPALKNINVAQHGDRIRDMLSKWDVTSGTALVDSLQTWTGNTAVSRLKTLRPSLFEDFDRKAEFLEKILTMEEFRVVTAMPGLLTGTNSTSLNGNTVSWDLFPMAFFFDDFTMTAESRVVNVWAFVLSGIVLMALAGLLAWKAWGGR